MIAVKSFYRVRSTSTFTAVGSVVLLAGGLESLGMKYKLMDTHAMRIPRNICRVGSKSKNHTDSTAVSSIALEVAYTLTIVSAYFMIL
jgi:hypothetical protein